MMIVMKPNATQEEIDHVIDRDPQRRRAGARLAGRGGDA